MKLNSVSKILFLHLPGFCSSLDLVCLLVGKDSVAFSLIFPSAGVCLGNRAFCASIRLPGFRPNGTVLSTTYTRVSGWQAEPFSLTSPKMKLNVALLSYGDHRYFFAVFSQRKQPTWLAPSFTVAAPVFAAVPTVCRDYTYIGGRAVALMFDHGEEVDFRFSEMSVFTPLS